MKARIVEVYGENLEIRFAVLVNGFQHGGTYDKSGAGNLTFATRKEARLYLAALYGANRATLLAAQCLLFVALLTGCAVRHEPIKTPVVCTCVIEHPDDWNTGTLDDPADCLKHGSETP